MPSINHESMAALLEKILTEIGEDPRRPGLQRTPERWAQSLEFLTQGYHLDAKEVISAGTFAAENKDMIVVRDIDFYSLCEHHLLPFFGRVHIAYIPGDKIIGLSKLPRVVEVFSRRLQMQERLTNQIGTALMEYLRPQGTAVVIEAHHLCMQMRGVQKLNSVAITSAMMGVFLTQPETRQEFMQLIECRLAYSPQPARRHGLLDNLRG